MVDEEKIIKDMIILGQAAPVEISGARKSICTAGWSPNEGMVRLYPVPTTTKARMWSKVQVPVIRNTQDVRYESWKIKGSSSEWETLNQKIIDSGRITVKSQKLEVLSTIMENHTYGCVNELNDEKGSLGIIIPKNIEGYFIDRKQFEKTTQMTLDSEVKFVTSENYPKVPMIKYTCSNCKAKGGFHRQQLLAWEAYEWMRQKPNDLDGLWTNLGFHDPEYVKYFLVGNQAYHLKSFMIISVIRFKKV